MLAHAEVLRILNKYQPDAVIFLQTVAERITVPTAGRRPFSSNIHVSTPRARRPCPRRGTLVYQEEELRFPYECKTSEREISEVGRATPENSA